MPFGVAIRDEVVVMVSLCGTCGGSCFAGTVGAMAGASALLAPLTFAA